MSAYWLVGQLVGWLAGLPLFPEKEESYTSKAPSWYFFYIQGVEYFSRNHLPLLKLWKERFEIILNVSALSRPMIILDDAPRPAGSKSWGWNPTGGQSQPGDWTLSQGTAGYWYNIYSFRFSMFWWCIWYLIIRLLEIGHMIWSCSGHMSFWNYFEV